MAVEPSFKGFIETTYDALLVFEGCRRGFLPKVRRRLQDVEKQALVVSGSVFVFDEAETGIRRWTDGMLWSPSRTLNNFLVYRQTDKRRGGSPSDGTLPDGETSLRGSARSREGASAMETAWDVPSTILPASASTSAGDPSTGVPGSERDRALVGSLTSGSKYRPDSLVKKTISVAGLHMIAYYKVDDVKSGRLRTPSSLPELRSLEISSVFLSPQSFRMPPATELGPDGQLRYKEDQSDAGANANSSAALISALSRPSSSSRMPSFEGTRYGKSKPKMSLSSSLPPPDHSASRSRTPSASSRAAHRFDPYTFHPRPSPTGATFNAPPPHDYGSPQGYGALDGAGSSLPMDALASSGLPRPSTSERPQSSASAVSMMSLTAGPPAPWSSIQEYSDEPHRHSEGEGLAVMSMPGQQIAWSSPSFADTVPSGRTSGGVFAYQPPAMSGEAGSRPMSAGQVSSPPSSHGGYSQFAPASRDSVPQMPLYSMHGSTPSAFGSGHDSSLASSASYNTASTPYEYMSQHQQHAHSSQPPPMHRSVMPPYHGGDGQYHHDAPPLDARSPSHADGGQGHYGKWPAHWPAEGSMPQGWHYDTAAKLDAVQHLTGLASMPQHQRHPPPSGDQDPAG